MGRVGRFGVSVVMVVITAWCALAAASRSVVHYALPSDPDGTEHSGTDVLGGAVAAAVVGGVATLILLGWLIWNVRTEPPRARWLAPVGVFAVAVVVFVIGAMGPTPTY